MTDPVQASKSAGRSGLANVYVTEAEKDHGDGVVQHVGMDREMVVKMHRLTDKYIKDELHMDEYRSNSLLDYNIRMKFGALAAKQLAAGTNRSTA